MRLRYLFSSVVILSAAFGGCASEPESMSVRSPVVPVIEAAPGELWVPGRPSSAEVQAALAAAQAKSADPGAKADANGIAKADADASASANADADAAADAGAEARRGRENP